jgi:hypothetical protein
MQENDQHTISDSGDAGVHTPINENFEILSYEKYTIVFVVCII